MYVRCNPTTNSKTLSNPTCTFASRELRNDGVRCQSRHSNRFIFFPLTTVGLFFNAPFLFLDVCENRKRNTSKLDFGYTFYTYQPFFRHERNLFCKLLQSNARTSLKQRYQRNQNIKMAIAFYEPVFSKRHRSRHSVTNTCIPDNTRQKAFQ